MADAATCRAHLLSMVASSSVFLLPSRKMGRTLAGASHLAIRTRGIQHRSMVEPNALRIDPCERGGRDLVVVRIQSTFANGVCSITQEFSFSHYDRARWKRASSLDVRISKPYGMLCCSGYFAPPSHQPPDGQGKVVPRTLFGGNSHLIFAEGGLHLNFEVGSSRISMITYSKVRRHVTFILLL